jgi:hypothetical protein
MKRMKGGLALAALSFALLGVTGCANLQPPAPAPARAPEEVHATVLQSALVLSIYHPDTRTMYVWVGDPRPVAKRPWGCIEIQLSDNPSDAPKTQICPGSAPASTPTIPPGTPTIPFHPLAGPPASAPASPPPSGH